MEQKIIEFLTSLADFEKINARHLAASMFDPTLSDNQISGSSSQEATKFYDNRRTLEDIALQARREIAGARLSEMRRAGSGNNNVERFNFIKESFNRELTEAYRRAQSIVHGLKAVYDIETTLPEISNVGFLNKLALWHKEVFYQLERRVMKTTSTTLAVAVRKADAASFGLIPDADYLNQRAASIFKFNLPANFFDQTTSKLKNPRLRGLEACAWTDVIPKPLDYIRLHVDLPDQSIKTATDTIWANTPSVTLPIVTFPQGSEFSFQARREVHNANPVGTWTIQVDKRTITDKETNKEEILRNIFLVMRISSDV